MTTQALQQALTEISANVYNWERDAIRSVADKALATVSDASPSVQEPEGWRAALLLALYHHQGGSSPVGQPIRRLLGVGQYDSLTDEQIAQAKSVSAAPAAPAVPGADESCANCGLSHSTKDCIYAVTSPSPVSVQPSTPSSRWAANGEPDPHGDSYDCERASLALGKMTDDELANAAFMNYDTRPPLQDIIDRKAFMPIVYMTAVKERIRWLSRSLEKALFTQPAQGDKPSHCSNNPSSCPDNEGRGCYCTDNKLLPCPSVPSDAQPVSGHLAYKACACAGFETGAKCKPGCDQPASVQGVSEQPTGAEIHDYAEKAGFVVGAFRIASGIYTRDRHNVTDEVYALVHALWNRATSASQPAVPVQREPVAVDEMKAETRETYDAMNAAQKRLVMERERGDMWQQKYLDLVAASHSQAATSVPDGWKLTEKANCFQLAHGNEVVALLSGPNVEANAAKIASMLAAAAAPSVRAEVLRDVDDLRHLVRQLAEMYVEFDRMRYEAANLPAEEIADFLICKIPVQQGTHNQIALKRIAEQECNKDAVRRAINAMLEDRTITTSASVSADAKDTLLRAAEAFAKAHIECDEMEALDDENSQAVSDDEYHTKTAAYNTTKASLLEAYHAAIAVQSKEPKGASE